MTNNIGTINSIFKYSTNTRNKAGKGLYAGVLFMVLIVPYFLQSFYRNNTSTFSSNLNPRENARQKEESNEIEILEIGDRYHDRSL